MPNIVESTDFTGAYMVPTDQYTEVPFEVIRDERQFELIYDMLGATLGNLFIADLDSAGIPQTARFTALFTAFQEDYNSELIKSEGIKAMVKYFVFFKFCRANNITVAITGNIESEAENSKRTGSVAWLVLIYNQAIATAHAIQHKISQNSADYPEYKGQEMEFMPLF